MRVDKALKFFKIQVKDKRKASYLCNDTRLIKENSIFVAIDNAAKYLDKLSIKPLVIITNQEIEGTIYIPDLKQKIGEFCSYFYNIKKNNPKLIGVTGTNGKTSVATLLHELLNKSYLITTIGNINKSYLSENTTPSAVEIANAIVETRRHKAKYLILEVSSIGIKENRVTGFDFSYLIFTNLTKDHLDYHKTIDDYHKTKLNFLKNSKAILLMNLNDSHVNVLWNRPHKTFGFAFNESCVIKRNLTNTIFQFDNYMLRTNLIGTFNIENLYAVLSLLTIMKEKIDPIKIETLKRVRGRMDIVSLKPNIIIDYAHTQEAMSKALYEAKLLCDGKLFVIFGAGGMRDKSKRKEYGNLALEYSDVAIITNDNPREEKEEDIVKDIIGSNEEKFEIILNRSEAIATTIKRLKEEDLLLILGKGHEEYQIVQNQRLKYSDYDEVEKWLKILKS